MLVLRRTPHGVKPILTGVCGRAAPGRFLALMGPSGAGKSSLLDVLAMRDPGGLSGGSVTVNGRPQRAADFLGHSAYVPQVGAGVRVRAQGPLACGVGGGVGSWGCW